MHEAVALTLCLFSFMQSVACLFISGQFDDKQEKTSLESLILQLRVCKKNVFFCLSYTKTVFA